MRVSTLMILGKYIAKRAIVAKAGNLRRFDGDKPVIPASRHGAKQESQNHFKQYRDSGFDAIAQRFARARRHHSGATATID
jgi:hypothetical protein